MQVGYCIKWTIRDISKGTDKVKGEVQIKNKVA